MADVLRRVEPPLRERAVELVERDQPGGRHVAPAASAAVARSLTSSRFGIRSAGSDDPLLRLPELGHRVALVLGRELAADGRPHFLLLVGVGDRRRGLSGSPGERRGSDLRCGAARYAGSFAPGWSCARCTVTEPSSPVRHGRVELSFLEHPSAAVQHSRPATASLTRIAGRLPILSASGSILLVKLTIDDLDARLITTLRESPRVGLLEVARRLKRRARHGPSTARKARA